jgi:uncharacterized protein (TIGR00369 family)
MQAMLPGTLQGLFGVELTRVEPGAVNGRMELRQEFMAPNDFLHAGAVVTLADSCCGSGCIASLPEGAAGFTTAEMKTNFLRSARVGDGLHCAATLAHGGQTTQIWDAVVTRESDDRQLALFRCTQYLLQASDARTERQSKMRG